MFRWMRPHDEVSGGDLDRGLKMLLYDAMASQTMVVLTLGPFLMAVAVVLGASNVGIGLVGAVGPLSQVLQLPAVWLVERLRMRKMLTVTLAAASRCAWIFIASIPLWTPPPWRIPLFLGGLVFFFGLNAVASCSFVSWSRDLIPDHVINTFFGRRLAVATAAGALVSLLGAFSIDTLAGYLGDPALPYTFVYAMGGLAGFVGAFFLGRVPEPRMHLEARTSLSTALAEPLRDRNFRSLTLFLAAWSFAMNLCGPFFAVYMLRRLGLNMSWVLGFSVLSQLFNFLFFRLWGRLADRVSNKSVLLFTGPVFVFSLLLWPLTSMDNFAVTIGVLVAFHVVAGIANAGIMLAANNLTYKTAPRGKGTSYLALNIVVQGVAATVAPILAGVLADALDNHHLVLSLSWIHQGAETAAYGPPPLDLHGIDFLFVLAFLFGLYALHRLLAVREEGEMPEEMVRREFFSEMERKMRQVSTVPGLRIFSNVSISVLGRVLGTRDNPAATAPETAEDP